jgi:hypothetical protein
MKTLVYLAMYNPMIHESVYGCLSVHKTQRGAEMAIEFDRQERLCDDGYSESVESWAVFSFILMED